MITDLLLINNDLSFDHSMLTIVGDDAIIQDAIENITIPYGQILIDDRRGNRLYGRRMKLTKVNLKTIEQDCIEAIIYDSRVASATVSVTRTNLLSCMVQFSIITTDGKSIDGSTSVNMA